MLKKLSENKISILLFLLCWISYCIANIGRINFSAALPAIIGGRLYTKSQAGMIGTVFFFCYAGGQIVNGYFGDKISPYKMIVVGLGVSGLCNIAFPFITSHVLASIIWGINGFSQSMLWPPILIILSKVLLVQMRKRAFLFISSSGPVGSILTYLLAMILMNYMNWKYIFVFSTILIVIIVAVWIFLSKTFASSLKMDEPPKLETVSSSTSRVNFKKVFIASGALMIAIPVLLQGTLKDGVNAWVPTMIMEMYQVSPSFSVFLTMFLPIVNVGGAYAASFLNRKFFKENEIATTILCFVFSAIPLCVLFFIGKINVFVCVLMLALFTSAMYGINLLLITIAAVRFAPYNKVAMVSGIFNALTYFGCAISNYGFGYLSDKNGWQSTIVIWIFIVLAAVIFLIPSLKRWNKFCKREVCNE